MGLSWSKYNHQKKTRSVIQLLTMAVDNKGAPEVGRLERVMAMVRSHAGPDRWGEIMDNVLSKRRALSETFRRIINVWSTDSLGLGLGHVLTLYTLFVDVLRKKVLKKESVHIETELTDLHEALQPHLGSSVLDHAFRLLH